MIHMDELGKYTKFDNDNKSLLETTYKSHTIILGHC